MRRLLALVTAVSIMFISYAGSSYASLYKEAEAQVVYYPEFRNNFFKSDKEVSTQNELKKALVRAEAEKKAKEEARKTQEEEQKTMDKQASEPQSAGSSGKESTTKKTATSKTSTTTQTKESSTLTRSQKIAIEQKKAEQILAKYISKYPILEGVKIYVRDCPNNWEGCAYYTKGIILVDPDHTHSLEEIIAHEVQHIIDYRTDGDIDYNDYHE